MQMKLKTLLILSLLVVVTALLLTCDRAKEELTSKAVVKVGSEVLTESDLKEVLPPDVNDEDSAALADEYINRWVRNKLFLRQAESNLTEEEKDVSQMLDEYRTSLLVNKYQQKMLEQKYSPLLKNEEIQQYYEQMQDNFTLQENIIKGLIMKVPLDAPGQNEVRRWCRSASSESLVQLENYSLQNARMYNVFLDTWVPFQRINANLPDPVRNEERFLKYNRYYETTDDQYRYFLLVTDSQFIGSIAPLAYVEERIKAILMNKKRGEFIKDLEKQLYEEALQQKNINFY